MRNRKNKAIAAAVVFAILLAAWLRGGDYAGNSKAENASPTLLAIMNTADLTATTTADFISRDPGGNIATLEPEASATPAQDTSATPTQEEPEIARATPTAAETLAAETPPPAPEIITPTPTPTDNTLIADSVLSGEPEPRDEAAGDDSFTVALSVRCDTLLDNMDLTDEEKRELIPGDGVIYSSAAVAAYEGESVFNVLQRELKRARIHMEFVNTPIYNSAYIEGINNLYAFDAGELSGWMYKVNDWFPDYGCSRYQLNPGDIVEWVYSCDLGKDVGVGRDVSGWQRDD